MKSLKQLINEWKLTKDSKVEQKKFVFKKINIDIFAKKYLIENTKTELNKNAFQYKFDKKTHDLIEKKFKDHTQLKKTAKEIYNEFKYPSLFKLDIRFKSDMYIFEVIYTIKHTKLSSIYIFTDSDLFEAFDCESPVTDDMLCMIDNLLRM